MIRSLAWKEYRQQRAVLLLGWGLAALLPVALALGGRLYTLEFGIDEVVEVLPSALHLLVGPLFGAAIGVATIGPELAGESLAYLLSQPAGRGRIWTTKVAVGAATLLALFAGETLLYLALDSMAGAETTLSAPGPRLAVAGQPPSVLTMLTPAVLAITAFLAGTLVSMFVAGTFSAITAALGAAIVIQGLHLLLWLRSDFTPTPDRLHLVWIWTAGAGIALLAASRIVFIRGELLRGGAVRRALLRALPVAVAIWALAIVAGLAVDGGPVPTQPRLRDVEVAGDRLVAVTRHPGNIPRVVTTGLTPGGDVRALGDRYTLSPTVSPDGRWIAYLRIPSLLGVRGDRLELWRHDREGGEAQRLARSLPWQLNPVRSGLAHLTISPDGRHVLYMDWVGRMVSVPARPDEGPPLVVSGPRITDGYGYVVAPLGWRGPSTFVVQDVADRRETVLRSVDVRDGRTTEIWSTDASSSLSSRFAREPMPPPASQGLVPILVERGSGHGPLELRIVELATGTDRLITDSACNDQPAILPTVSVLYAACPPRLATAGPGSRPVREFRLRSLTTESETTLHRLPDGRLRAVSPDGRYAILTSWGDGERGSATWILEIERGAVRRAAMGPPVAWLADGTLLAFETVRGERLVAVDPDSGDRRDVDP